MYLVKVTLPFLFICVRQTRNGWISKRFIVYLLVTFTYLMVFENCASYSIKTLSFLVFSIGKSDSRASSATRRDLLPLGTQLFHGLQSWQRLPGWLCFWDHVHPCFPFHWAQHNQLLWDNDPWPQRHHILVPQVRESLIAGWIGTNVWVGPRLMLFVSRMHLALKAYQELLLNVNEMDQSKDEAIQQSSNVIKSKMVVIRLLIW